MEDRSRQGQGVPRCVTPSLSALNAILTFGKSKKQYQRRLPLLDLRLSIISPLPVIALRRLMALKVEQEMPHAINVSSLSMMRSSATQLLVCSNPPRFVDLSSLLFSG